MFVGRVCFRWARFFRRFHIKFKLDRHVVMQFDRHFVFTRVFDRSFEDDLVAVDLMANLVLDSSDDILRGNRAERFSGLTGREREGDPHLVNSSGDFFRFVQLARFAFGAFLFQIIELAQPPVQMAAE